VTGWCGGSRAPGWGRPRDGDAAVATLHACGEGGGDAGRGVSGSASACTGAEVSARAAPTAEPASAASACSEVVRAAGATAGAACVADAWAARVCGDADAAGPGTGWGAPSTVPHIVVGVGVRVALAALSASACAACARIVGGSAASARDEEHVGVQQDCRSTTAACPWDADGGSRRGAACAAGPVAVSAAATGPGARGSQDGLAYAAHDDGVDRARGHRHGGFGLTPQTGVTLVVRATCRAVDHEGGLGDVGGHRPALRCSGVVEDDRSRALRSGTAVPADACRMLWHRLSSGQGHGRVLAPRVLPVDARPHASQ
jgi:hypothetical protein